MPATSSPRLQPLFACLLLGLPALSFGATQDVRTVAVEPMSLSVEDVVALALQNNIGLRIDSFAEEVQRYTHLGTWGAFDPIASVTGSYTDSQQPAQSSLAGANVVKSDTLGLNAGLQLPFEGGGKLDLAYDHRNTSTNSSFSIDDTLTNSSLSLSYNQPLLRGAWSGYNTVEQEKSELRWDQAKARHQQLIADLERDVIHAYWNLIAAREALGVQEETLALGQQQLEQNRRRLKVGVGTEVEVLQAETNVATQTEVLLRTKTNVTAADDALKSLIFARSETDGWSVWYAWWDRPILPTTPLPEVSDEDIDWTASLASALSARPELVQLRIDIELSEFDLLRARSEERAALDLNLSLTSSGVDGQSNKAIESAATFEFPTASASLTYSTPLFNRTAESALEAARLGLRSARLGYEQAETGILTEVRSAVRDSRYQAEAVRAAGVSFDLATRQLEAEQARFAQGLSTNFQVLEYQQQLSQAKSNLVAARVTYAKAGTALLRAEGRLSGLSYKNE